MNSIIYAVQINDTKKIGLHARPVSMITGVLTPYKETEVWVVKLEDKVDISLPITLTGKEIKGNAKSVLSFLGLQITNLTKIAFIIEGPHAEDIKTAIKSVLKKEELI